MRNTPEQADNKPSNFLTTIVEKDLASKKVNNIVTRFPPEPNGYLHIGHAKSICLNFGLAQQFGGQCHLRFDDTNPEKESQEYIDAITSDVEWLGFKWHGDIRYSSNYFDELYEYALHLIKTGFAYVCELNAEQAREYRGSLTQPGKNSPNRDQSVEENLALFEKMRSGELDEGAATLRAKIDMSSGNINLRDPILYRIRKIEHHQTKDKWCIYPNYDFTHGQSDAMEGITHSICTLEFEDHRPLYEWFLEHLPVPCKPTQYEFARLNVNYTVTSKRKLKQLVDSSVVNGWDDPRMPTISGMRKRGVPASALRNFCDMVGTSRAGGIVDLGMLDFAMREELNEIAPRAMCVMDPIKVVLTNYAEEESVFAPVHPKKEEMGKREIKFTSELYIDAADFSEDTTLSKKKFKRLVMGDFVRLRSSYVIKANEVIKDENGKIVELHCEVVPGTVGAKPPEGIKPRGVIHWVSAKYAKPCTVNLYDRLFNHEAPDKGDNDFMDHINPESLKLLENCWVEPGVENGQAELAFQFEREGYFVLDQKDSSNGELVFNKTIGLKDTWAK